MNRWNKMPNKVGKYTLHDINEPELFAKYLDQLPVASIVPNPVFDYLRP